MKNISQPQEKNVHGGQWRRFFGFFRKVRLSWGWIIASLVISIAYYGLVSFIPGSTAALYSGDFSMAAIMGLVINMTGTMVLSFLVSAFRIVAEGRSVRSLRNSVWKRMMGIQTSYYDSHDAGNLYSAVTSDAEMTVTQLITVIISLPSIIMYLFMCFAQISAYSTKLILVFFVLIPVYVLYAIFMGRWQYKTGNSIQMRIGGLTGFLTERIRNLSLIKSFATEQKEETQGVLAAKSLYKANVQYQYVQGTIVGYTFLTDAVTTVIAVIWGCMLLRGGEITLEAWLAFFLFVPMVTTIFRQISMAWGNIKEVQGRAARMSAMLDAPQENLNAGASAEIPQGDIVFDHVSFSYTEGKEVLSDLSFTLPRGKKTAIVGASGSGKTTILKLVEKLYTPAGGKIAVGSADIDGLNLMAWREKLSYVTQEAAVFGGTIRECLTYGIARPVADEELERVAKLAGILDYIKGLEGGFNAPLAIWGSAISGGQRQRLVIARELLKAADILLLDEPTSALDAETAAQLSQTVFDSFAGKTMVIVTHELNFISQADQIIVLDQGRIAGSGSHATLMESCKIYRNLVEEQSYQEVYEH